MPQIAWMHVFRITPLLDGHDAVPAIETLRGCGFSVTVVVLTRLLLLLPMRSAHVGVGLLF